MSVGDRSAGDRSAGDRSAGNGSVGNGSVGNGSVGNGSGAGPRLLLVRHGQTEANITRALDSRPPGYPLNALGREQAERVADRLVSEPITVVYASVAPRAQQTAAPIADRHGLPVHVIDDVQEIFCGDYEGRADHEARKRFDEVYRRWVAGELELRMPGGESAAEVRDRVLPVLNGLWQLHAEHPNGMIVVVSHGAAIQLSARAMIGDYRIPRYVPNTGRVLLAPTENPASTAPTESRAPSEWRLERWDTAQDAGVPDPRGDVTGGAYETPDPAE
ncbi:MAG: histidine phosphatase family protein [Actinomycetota bacterium]|nr:histidine phosphatase family protein [Actinomycetota bacterium]